MVDIADSMNKKICKVCGSEDCIPNRRFCADCYILYNKQRAQKYYREKGKERRRTHQVNTCVLCGQSFPHGGRKNRKICPVCYKQSLNTGFKQNQYKMAGCRPAHRVFAESILGRKLTFNEVVHHIDENIQNNDTTNLIVIPRSEHARLHMYLRKQRVLYEKSLDENSVNCWDNLRVPQTTAWLETTGANVIKLWELVNQQPSLSNNEEGSETKQGAPKSK